MCTLTGNIYKEMYIWWEERIKTFLLKNDYSFQQLEKKVHASLGFFVTIIDNEKFVVLSTFPVVINHQETYLLIGSQSFVITAVYYLRML